MVFLHFYLRFKEGSLFFRFLAGIFADPLGSNHMLVLWKLKRYLWTDPVQYLDRRMIQRKQSLFLLLAALLAFATWLFPISSYERNDGTYQLKSIGLFAEDGSEVADVGLRIPFAAILTVIGAGLLFCIFLYRNRTRQMRFVRAAFLLTLAVTAFMFITDNSVQAYLMVDHVLVSKYGPSFYIPLVILVLCVLAERSIKADDALVRSADRLR